MQEKQPQFNNTRLVVSALLTGADLKSRDIAQMVSEASGKEIKTGNVSGILSRISDQEKCDLGFFIHKSRQGNALIYRMAEEALVLPENYAYGLTQKTGTDRYPLEQATRDFPALRKYVEPDMSSPRPAIRVIRQLASTVGPGKLVRVTPRVEQRAEDRSMEVSLRYSSKYAISVTTSFSTFVLICCALVMTLAACCFLAYAFFYHLLIVASVVAGVCFAGLYFWKSRVSGKT